MLAGERGAANSWMKNLYDQSKTENCDAAAIKKNNVGYPKK